MYCMYEVIKYFVETICMHACETLILGCAYVVVLHGNNIQSRSLIPFEALMQCPLEGLAGVSLAFNLSNPLQGARTYYYFRVSWDFLHHMPIYI